MNPSESEAKKKVKTSASKESGSLKTTTKKKSSKKKKHKSKEDKDKNKKGKELYDHGGFKDQRNKNGTYNKQHYHQKAFRSETEGNRSYNNKQHKNKYYECESGVASYSGFYRSVSIVSRRPRGEVVGRREARAVGAGRAHSYVEPLCSPCWETWTRHKKNPKNNKILGTVSGKIKGELAQQIRGPSESRGPTGKGQTKFGTF